MENSNLEILKVLVNPEDFATNTLNIEVAMPEIIITEQEQQELHEAVKTATTIICRSISRTFSVPGSNDQE